MNKNQVKGHSNEAKGKVKEAADKVTGDERKPDKDKANNQGGKDGAVLADVNGDAKTKSKTKTK